MRRVLRHVVGTPKEIEEFSEKMKLQPKDVQTISTVIPVVLWYWAWEE